MEVVWVISLAFFFFYLLMAILNDHSGDIISQSADYDLNLFLVELQIPYLSMRLIDVYSVPRESSALEFIELSFAIRGGFNLLLGSSLGFLVGLKRKLSIVLLQAT